MDGTTILPNDRERVRSVKRLGDGLVKIFRHLFDTRSRSVQLSWLDHSPPNSSRTTIVIVDLQMHDEGIDVSGIDTPDPTGLPDRQRSDLG